MLCNKAGEKMEPVKVYLSHGLGVNSWALYLLLIEQGQVPGVDFEAVAVDHGADKPESYEYLEMMMTKGYPVTVIKPNYGGFDNLYDYCLKYAILPSRIPGMRWCTENFKTEVVKKYRQTPCIELIGFDAGEPGRAKSMHEREGSTFDYPLISEGIDRQGCIDLIKRHGLPVPIKSGCYVCPFQGRKDWMDLRKQHPELFCKARTLEILCNQRRMESGKEPIYFRDMPLDDLIQVKDHSGRRAAVGQTEMFDSHDRPPCRCSL